MTEAEVTSEITDFLRERGWRLIRMQSGLFRSTSGYRGRVRVGEVGMCDWLCIQYPFAGTKQQREFYAANLPPEDSVPAPNVFWLEVKAPGKKLRKGQPEWIAAERDKGALVCVADSLESFKDWYQGKGWEYEEI